MATVQVVSPLGLRLARARSKARRSARGLSLAVGASHSVVDHLEKGRIVSPRAELIRRLAEELGVHAEWLLTGKGPRFVVGRTGTDG